MSPQTERRRLLIVDDDDTSRLLAQLQLKRAGYEVSLANDVPVAIDILKREGCGAFDAVVSDYCMPGGTGMDILCWIRDVDATLSMVVMTAVGEKKLVSDLLREGVAGFIDKPVVPDVLRDLVGKAVARTCSQRKLCETATEATALGESQLALLGMHTAVLSDRIEIAYIPHSQASGDFVTAFALSDERFVVLASDVSGHDLKAAYKSIYFHGLARGMIEQSASIKDVFYRFNSILLDDWNTGSVIETSIATLAVCVDMGERSLLTLNCGFPAHVCADVDGWVTSIGKSGTSPLGWFPKVPLPEEAELPEGAVLFWSDGLEGLAQTLDIDPLSLAYRLHLRDEDNDSLLGYANDDIVVVRANPNQLAELNVPLIQRVYTGAQVGEVDRIQEFCGRSLRIALPGVKENRLIDVLLCLRESVINALEHGCERRADKTATVQMAIQPARGVVRLRVADGGSGYDFNVDEHEDVAARELIPEHRGLVMLKHLSTNLRFENRGSTVTMEFQI